MNVPAPAVISGEYADYKRIKGRKVLQVIVEVPIERAPEVHRVLGEPDGAASKWVAVALLDKASATPTAPRKATRAGKCAMTCTEPRFWTFLTERDGRHVVDSTEGAAGMVRALCGVPSRSDLNVNPEAAERWERLHGDYLAWLEA